MPHRDVRPLPPPRGVVVRGVLFSLYAALGGTPPLVLAVTGTVLDLLYAVFQDVWTFPKPSATMRSIEGRPRS